MHRSRGSPGRIAAVIATVALAATLAACGGRVARLGDAGAASPPVGAGLTASPAAPSPSSPIGTPAAGPTPVPTAPPPTPAPVPTTAATAWPTATPTPVPTPDLSAVTDLIDQLGDVLGSDAASSSEEGNP